MSRSSKDKRQTNEPRHQTEVSPTESEDSDLVAAIVQHARAEFFAGPLPRPDMLRGYDEVVPGSAERIVTMAEVQAAHRRDIETQEASDNTAVARAWAFSIRWSPILGMFSVTLLVAVAVYLIAIGQYTEGVSTTLGAAIVLSVISLLNRRAMRQSE